MNFDISKRFHTNVSTSNIVAFLESSFKNVAATVHNNGVSLSVEDVNATFGSINRSDKTVVNITLKDEDILLVADVTYKPSIWFWIFLVCGLFTTVGWLVPIVFYLYQKNTVKVGIEEVFNRCENEFRNSSNTTLGISSDDVSVKLQKLKAMKDQGLISEEEFNKKKAELLEKM
ncbi:MAG: SHOCT domain-containing protein [Spirochaetaceae bacterium]|nr:SHOCT domain-containing protein [Spirochaetaceae bacterium]